MKRKAVAVALGLATEALFTAMAAPGFGPCGPGALPACIWMSVHLPALAAFCVLPGGEGLAMAVALLVYGLVFAALWYIAFLKPTRAGLD
jgi:hypothetical protein